MSRGAILLLGACKNVQFHRSARDHYAARGMYVVTKQLPENNGEFEYRVRSPNEAHERIARESELSRP